MTYKFDKKNHIHELDGKPLMGVTSVLKIIAKPALIQWAANMAVDYIKEHVPHDGRDEGLNQITYRIEDFNALLEEARTAHRKKKEGAGDWGTIVHEAIEDWIKNGTVPILEESQQKAFDNFVAWSKENNVKFLESEKHLYSEEMWVGGICDLLIEMNGKKYVADIKTSSAIYNEHFYQMAAYGLMLREMGLHDDIDGFLVINLKKNGEIDTKIAYDMALNEEAFKHALGLYKIISRLEK